MATPFHCPGVARQEGVGRERGGDFVAVSESDAWFTYYYWMDDAVAPDFARCVDIHRKPGYDPVELFVDPEIKAKALKIGWFLLKKKLGFRALLDVIPLDATWVKGSHGRIPDDEEDWPVFVAAQLEDQPKSSTDVYGALKSVLNAQ